MYEENIEQAIYFQEHENRSTDRPRNKGSSSVGKVKKSSETKKPKKREVRLIIRK